MKRVDPVSAHFQVKGKDTLATESQSLNNGLTTLKVFIINCSIFEDKNAL